MSFRQPRYIAPANPNVVSKAIMEATIAGQDRYNCIQNGKCGCGPGECVTEEGVCVGIRFFIGYKIVCLGFKNVFLFEYSFMGNIKSLYHFYVYLISIFKHKKFINKITIIFYL